jgi:hypothetical protein
MANATMTSFASLLKKWYTPERIRNMVLENSPTLGMVSKQENLEGESFELPLITNDVAGGSATFSMAQANREPTGSVKFSVTTINDYASISIDRKLLHSAKTEAGALLKAKKVEMDSAVNVCRRSLSASLFRNGTGDKGTVSSCSGNTIILTSKWDCLLFQKGEYVQVIDDTDDSTLLGTSAKAKITAIDKANGILTFAADPTVTWGTIAAGDRVLRAGDKNAVLSGFRAWIPASAPAVGGGDSFFGVDRSADPVALAGCRVSKIGVSIVEALIDGQNEVAVMGDGSPDVVVVHPTQFAALMKELIGKAQYTSFTNEAGISYPGAFVNGNEGKIRLVPDRWCPIDQFVVLQLEDWKLRSMGQMPDIFDRGTDQEMLRISNEDAYEIRVGGYGQLTCAAPGHSGIIVVDAIS